MRKITVNIFIALVIAGCSSTDLGPKFNEPLKPLDGMATVYIYRPATSVNMAIDKLIFINGKKSFVVPNGSYVATHLPPGETSFETRSTGQTNIITGHELKLSFNLEAGKAYYIA
ncbi:MAG: DUF2846 domain-containing protein, partial [Gammaproteobacteria bacterium]